MIIGITYSYGCMDCGQFCLPCCVGICCRECSWLGVRRVLRSEGLVTGCTGGRLLHKDNEPIRPVKIKRTRKYNRHPTQHGKQNCPQSIQPNYL